MATDDSIQTHSTSMTLYCASGMGAVVVGFCDILSNEKGSFTLKIGAVFFNGYDTATLSLISLIILMCFGFLANWLNPAKTKVEAFQRGLAIFALLNTITPFQHSQLGGLSSSANETKTGFLQYSFGVSEAYAQANASMGSFNVEIKSSDPSAEPDPKVWVTIREGKSKEVLGGDWVQGKTTITRPRGEYFLDIEASGYKSSRYKIAISGLNGDSQTDQAKQENTILLESSKVPLPLQRFFPLEEKAITERSASPGRMP